MVSGILCVVASSDKHSLGLLQYYASVKYKSDNTTLFKKSDY